MLPKLTVSLVKFIAVIVDISALNVPVSATLPVIFVFSNMQTDAITTTANNTPRYTKKII